MSWGFAGVAGVVAVAAAAQILSGIGFSLICAPLLIAGLGHGDGIRVAVILSIVLNVAGLVTDYRLIRVGDAVRLFVPAAAFVLPTLLLSSRLGDGTISLVSGCAILLATALLVSGRRFDWIDGPAGALAAGAVSGVLTALAAATGPPVALFAAHRGWPPRVAAATLQAYALPLNVVTLVALGLPAAQTGRLAAAVVGLSAGTAAALVLARRIDPAPVRWLTVVVAAGGAVLLIVRGLS
jgi:uncharacterized membrane protein YfcA